jgi:hypothetical protein
MEFMGCEPAGIGGVAARTDFARGFFAKEIN